MQKICRVSGDTFQLDENDRQMLEKLTPRLGEKEFLLPEPELCPNERKRHRLAFRNERNLYRRKCDMSGRSIISLYSPESDYRVYAKDVWWSDRYDPLAYGRDVDFSRPFFEQFAELKKAIPKISLVTDPWADENNCEYINFAGNSRNCYMVFDSDFNEDSCHSNVLKHSKYCLDCSYVSHSELCYECIDCTRCYHLTFSQKCTNCHESAFLYNCIGCSHCIGCVNLVRKQYCIENRQLSREKYFEELEKLEFSSRLSILQYEDRFRKRIQEFPHKFCHTLKCENCLGDCIFNSKNCHYCFNIGDGEDLRYCDSLYAAKDCCDVSSFGENIERVYSAGTIGIQSYDIWFSFGCVESCVELLYCDECRVAKYCFGCAGVKRNEYCILNKQYPKEEYHHMVHRVIEHMQQTGEWGQHFPISLSPFGYNETVAQEHFPLEKADAENLGARWSAYQAPAPELPVILSAGIPDDIRDVSDDILKRALADNQESKPFRLTTPELDLHRRLGVPLQPRHPNDRHNRRTSLRNPQRLWERTCPVSGETIWSSYHPARPERVLSDRAFAESLT